MSDRPDKEQMMKIVMPALAIAVVIVLIGVLIAFRDNPDTTAPGDGKKPAAGAPTDLPTGIKPEDVNTDGLSPDKPSESGTEWKDVGEGLKAWDVKEGAGLPAQAGSTVTIHYTGWTLNGKMFDSSVYDPVTGKLKGTSPATFPLARLVAGWQKGIPGMKPGGIRRLYIPWPLGYGEEGSPPNIPSKADLIFEIKYFGGK